MATRSPDPMAAFAMVIAFPVTISFDWTTDTEIGRTFCEIG